MVGNAPVFTPKWIAPPKAQDTYQHASSGALASINHDTAGARTEGELPKGDKEYQLYSLATPNGQKIGIALEEFELEYDAHLINILKGDQFTSGFVDLNPNSKIPAIRRHVKDGGEPVDVFESGAILLYLAEQYNKFIPAAGTVQRTECYSWLMWQMASQGPMFGQFGHFYKYAPRDKIDAINYGVARYSAEVRRLLSVMEQHLKQNGGRTWWLGDEYTIVDMAIHPWVTALGEKGYDALEFLEVEERYPNVVAWSKRVGERPAVQRGIKVCGF